MFAILTEFANSLPVSCVDSVTIFLIDPHRPHESRLPIMPPVANPQLHLAKMYFPAIGSMLEQEVHEY